MGWLCSGYVVCGGCVVGICCCGAYVVTYGGCTMGMWWVCGGYEAAMCMVCGRRVAYSPVRTEVFYPITHDKGKDNQGSQMQAEDEFMNKTQSNKQKQIAYIIATRS